MKHDQSPIHANNRYHLTVLVFDQKSCDKNFSAIYVFVGNLIDQIIMINILELRKFQHYLLLLPISGKVLLDQKEFC